MSPAFKIEMLDAPVADPALDRLSHVLVDWLLVLDTVPGENGPRVYRRAGWTQSGIIPDYALFRTAGSATPR